MPNRVKDNEKPPRWTINPPHEVARWVLAECEREKIKVSAFFVRLARAAMNKAEWPACAVCPDRRFVEVLARRIGAEITQLEESEQMRTINAPASSEYIPGALHNG